MTENDPTPPAGEAAGTPHTEPAGSGGSRPGEPARRPLTRSRDDRVIAGVCGGIAKRFDIDPLLVRIIAVVLILVGGATIIAYLAAVLLLPAEGETSNDSEPLPRGRASMVLGGIAIVAAICMAFGWVGGSDIAWWPGAVAGLAVAGAVCAVLALLGRRLFATVGGEPSTPFARFVGAVLIGFAVLVGAAALSAVTLWVTAVAGTIPAAAAVLTVGVLMVAVALTGRPALWLAVPAVAIAIPAAAIAASGIRFDGSAGDRTYAPSAISQIHGEYRLGLGQVEVDLKRMHWPQTADPVTVRLNVGAGRAMVVVPRGVCVMVRPDIRAGEAAVLGTRTSGLDVDEPIGAVDRFHGRRLIVDGEIDVGQLIVSTSSWRHNDDWQAVGRSIDDETIAPALAEAGCAGRPR